MRKRRNERKNSNLMKKTSERWGGGAEEKKREGETKQIEWVTKIRWIRWKCVNRCAKFAHFRNGCNEASVSYQLNKSCFTYNVMLSFSTNIVRIAIIFRVSGVGGCGGGKKNTMYSKKEVQTRGTKECVIRCLSVS